jgi:D-alanyl-D-alanine carboxypeptidase/D-alanyl-D-alanine-endopeptidase (penicillin-binding protein 4)
MEKETRKDSICARMLVIFACALFASGLENSPALCQARNKKQENKRIASTQKFARRVDVLLNAAAASKGEWGILIVDAASGETLYEQNADKYFIPASNMKLFTTALALAKLGPDYRFHTTLETRGGISADGILTGDVVLVGRGDPNLSNRKFPYELKEEFDGPTEKVLAELADALVARGVKEISGDVVGDDSYFPRERYPHGWEIDDVVWEYGAAISAIAVNDNTVSLTLVPGEKAGDAVQAMVTPPTRDFIVENRVVTAAAGVKPDLVLTREPGAKLVAIKGTLPAKSTPRKLVLAIAEPAEHAAMLMKSLLEERGVRISGTARARHEADGEVIAASKSSDGAATILAEHVSVALRDSTKLVNKISQNLHTELLLRTAARQNGMWNTPEELAKFESDFYAAAGIAPDDIVQTDGSGLSRRDLITPRAVVTLLKYAKEQIWFVPYYASLPVAGLDGTLTERMKNTRAAGRVHAKTGSVEHVKALSGYAETADGRELIFSFLSNNQAGKGRETADVMDGLCVAMVEEFNAKAAGARPRKR